MCGILPSLPNASVAALAPSSRLTAAAALRFSAPACARSVPASADFGAVFDAWSPAVGRGLSARRQHVFAEFPANSTASPLAWAEPEALALPADRSAPQRAAGAGICLRCLARTAARAPSSAASEAASLPSARAVAAGVAPSPSCTAAAQASAAAAIINGPRDLRPCSAIPRFAPERGRFWPVRLRRRHGSVELPNKARPRHII